MGSLSPGAARAGRRLFQVAVVACATALAVQRYLARGVDRPAEFTGTLVAAGLFIARALADAAGLGSRVRFRGVDIVIESLGLVLAGQVLSSPETARALAEALLVIGLVVGFVVEGQADRPAEA
ncbi:hypothetical protein MX659_08800 [Coriobacteriia bacterium Es71-Z0120]|uniref:hypothetical protein n=1 Tax=Parvivirga hydrogeniphila TaxID=2939460 RepID=UPI002260D2AB|nr:hypothetical protein [Parvivirga hydrogeniphila]MCL4079681.1 hypothetical protein [Parvivirga hydrogeniphila]